MNHKNKNNRHSLPLLSLAVLIAITFTSTAFGFGTLLETTETMGAMETLQGAQTKSRPPRRPQKKTLQELPEQENTEKTPTEKVDGMYTLITKVINNGSTIRPGEATQLLVTIKKVQPSVSTFDLSTSTKYYILTAWLNYFNNNLKYAQQAARRAYMENPQSKDAQITKTALSILAGRKPVPIPDNSQTQSNTGPELLNLDIESIETEFLGFRLQEMDLNCLNSTTLNYKYGDSNICILLWKISKLKKITKLSSIMSPTEPNEPTGRPKKRKPRNGYYEDEEEDYGYTKNEIQKIEKPKYTVATEIEAFKSLFVRTFALKNIKFVAVNTDPVKSKNDVLKTLLKNAWPWAQVMAYENTGNAAQFQGITLHQDKPMLLIAGKDGTIKYAGPATGFLPPMVVYSLSNASFSSSPIVNTTTSAPAKTRPKSAYNQPRPTQQPGLLPPVGTQQEMSLEDEFQAGKLLEYAKMLIKTGSRYTTPKKGIETCRQILNDYPSTKYAEEARMLLRKVPERYRKRYNLTNEELGL